MFKPVYTLSNFNPREHAKCNYSYRMFIHSLSTHYEDVGYLLRHLNILVNIYKAEARKVFGHLYENPHAIYWIEKQLENHPNEVDWTHLSRNPGAIPILKRHMNKVNWEHLAQNTNPDAIALLEVGVGNRMYRGSFSRLFWYYLCANPHAIPILEKNLNHIDWHSLSSNPSAIPFLEKHLDKVDWFNLSANPSAIPLLEKHMDKVDWFNLSANPSAVHWLEQNVDKIHWCSLCKNPHPRAMDLLENNMHDVWVALKLHWGNLCANPGAVHLLEKYAETYIADKEETIQSQLFERLARNPNPEASCLLKPHLKSIFDGWVYLGNHPNVGHIFGTLNYSKMREQCMPFARELAEYVFHPARLLRVCDIYDMDLADYIELIGD